MEAALVAAGHDGAQQGEGVFIKPSTLPEINFYQSITAHPTALNEFIPQFMGILTAQPSHAGAQSPSNPAQPGAAVPDPPYLVLEDVCAGFHSPAIMDVKLGSQLWDEHASVEKQQRLQEVSRSTTSGSLGFRIAGLNVVDSSDGRRRAYGKEFGRKATKDTITAHLAAFWPDLRTNEYIRDVCLPGIIGRLEDLAAVLSRENLAMHSASVFLVYEGDLASLADTVQKIMQEAPSEAGCLDSTTDPNGNGDDADSADNGELSCDEDELPPRIFDVRLIDFAHTKFASEPDRDTLRGVQNLITELKKLEADYN